MNAISFGLHSKRNAISKVQLCQGICPCSAHCTSHLPRVRRTGGECAGALQEKKERWKILSLSCHDVGGIYDFNTCKCRGAGEDIVFKSECESN
jgi:hypothetical protein